MNFLKINLLITLFVFSFMANAGSVTNVDIVKLAIDDREMSGNRHQSWGFIETSPALPCLWGIAFFYTGMHDDNNDTSYTSNTGSAQLSLLLAARIADKKMAEVEYVLGNDYWGGGNQICYIKKVVL